MSQTCRILIVIGSHESVVARRWSHRQALDTLQHLTAEQHWEVVFLDLTPGGHYELPFEISEIGAYTNDCFSKFEVKELLRSVRLDFACSFLYSRGGLEIFQQLVRELKLPVLPIPDQSLEAELPRWNASLGMASQMSMLNRLSQVYLN